MFLICLATASAAFAQGQGNVTLSGTVVDNVGVVPGATVTATNTAAGLVRTAVTNEEGTFRLVSLPPGRYTVKVSMTGFKEISVAEMQLMAGEVRDLGKLTLMAGGVQETVNVTAEITPVQTTSSALQKNLSADLLTSVQVKGRDIFGMLKILPGVVDVNPSRDFTNWASGRSLAINGGNSLNKNTTIDGVPVGEEGGNGTTYVTPNIDAVAEVNVISSGYTAENGRMASGQVAMVTKSGTNQFKGSAWYNGRRDWMNKNSFFRVKQNQPKSAFAVDIAGFSIGGPVILPGFNSRTSNKKVFFFGSEEYTRDVRPSALLYNNLPTPAERAGDFSQTFYCASAGSKPCTRDAAGNLVDYGSTTLLPITNPYASSGVTDFFCAPGTGGLSGKSCVGTSAATNVINPKYFNPMGRSMLNLLPLPNNQYNPAPGQAWGANNTLENLPEHVRTNLVTRGDVVLSQKTRFSIRALFDRDDNTSYSDIMPGVGSSDNVFPGQMFSGTLTQVVRPTVVNELTVGFSLNHWGFKARRGPIVASDYTQWYRDSVGIDPPRLAPFGAYSEPHLSTSNADQYPYLPYMLFSGGSYANYGYARFAGSSGPLPRWNQNYRNTFADDLTVVRGRHSFKFGFSGELDSKTEPGSQDYVGSYNFGHSADNPLSTNNGYANALIGVFTSYTERDRRVDADRRHWLTEGYAQDTWRLNPRFTLDYGLRITHSGSLYEARGYNSGFDPALFQTSQIPKLYTPYCKTGVAGNATCSSSNRFAKNPITGEVVSQAFAGTIVPNSGNVANGEFLNGVSSMGRPGQYERFAPVSWGPRVGFAWDVNGDGKTAIRGATGVFYNLLHNNNYGFQSGPLVSIQRQVLNAKVDDIDDFVKANNLAVTPQNIRIPYGYPLNLYGQQMAPTSLQPERHYQANFAVQRDIGFNTVVEVAWVGNYGRHYATMKTMNNVPVDAYANAKNLFNNEAIAANFIRRDYPGIGAIQYNTTNEVGLNYNSLQISAQRRLSHGFQGGFAYTLAKGLGNRGWDFVTEELYGAAGLRARYYGPQTANDQGQERRHVLVFHYSYQIPTWNKPVVKYILAGWEASGVTTMVTGDPVNPTCNVGSGISGIANNDPTLAGVGFRCDLVAEQSILSGYDANPTGSAALEDQLHFNPNAFQRPLPTNTTFTKNGVLGAGAQGNLGSAPWGVLRNPGWSNWDFTLARRIPVKVGRGGNMRVQIQFYNLFNQAEFNTLGATYAFTDKNATGGFGGGNTNTQTGKYTNTQNPFNGSVTIRFDY